MCIIAYFLIKQETFVVDTYASQVYGSGIKSLLCLCCVELARAQYVYVGFLQVR